MKTTYTAIAVLAAGAELASATFFDASRFSCPSNTNNECNPKQATGFDWSDLNIGSFQKYGDFSFSGWSCAGSFGSGRKRDVLTGRTFQDKCITAQAHHEKAKSPSFGCGDAPSVKDFSVTQFEVSTEFDCELEFHFEMPDKSFCKQKSHCAKGGSVVKNKQCGGATSVTVVYPTQTQGPGTTKTACSLGVHSMSFDCNSASSTVNISTKTRSTTTKSTPVSTPAQPTSYPAITPTPVPSSYAIESSPTPSVSIPQNTSSSALGETPSSSTPVVPETTPIPSASIPGTILSTSSHYQFPNVSSSLVVPSTSSPVVETTPVASVPVVETTPVPSVPVVGTPPVPSVPVVETTPISSVPVVETYPVSSVPVVETTPVSSAPVAETTPAPSSPAAETTPVSSYPPVDVVTVIKSTTTTVCPVTLTHVTEGTTSFETATTTSTIVSTITSTVCTKCSAPATTPVSPATPVVPAGPVETAPCPEVLPSCLNTWLFSEGCSSNTDADCYCPSSEFVQNVFGCLSAYAADDDEIAKAQTYFQGICAPHIPGNPAIITGATPAVPTNPAAPATTTVPVTTIQIYTTLTVPCVESTGISSGSIIPSSSVTTILSTYLTIPQVIFQTITGSTTVSADLVVGTPASTSAVTTPAVGGEVYPTLPIPTLATTGAGNLTYPTGAGNLTTTPTPTGTISTGSASQNTVAFGVSFAVAVLAILAL